MTQNEQELDKEANDGSYFVPLFIVEANPQTVFKFGNDSIFSSFLFQNKVSSTTDPSDRYLLSIVILLTAAGPMKCQLHSSMFGTFENFLELRGGLA